MNTNIDTNLIKAIGERIRALRKEQKLTIEQLAERCEPQLNSNYLGEVERGEYNISISGLLRIAVGLDVPLQDLIPASYPCIHNQEVEDRLQNLLGAARDLQVAEIDYFIKMIREYKEALKPAVECSEQQPPARQGRKPGQSFHN